MDMAGSFACTECKAASQKISELTDELDVLKAQRDHYSARCDELTTELGLARQQLNEKFKISDCSPNDSSLFDSESVERLLKLFWMHLGSAIDITYIYSNEEEPASVWAKAAFVEFLRNIDSLSDYSHLTFVGKALEKGLASPNLLDIPLARKFAWNTRVTREAVSHLLALQSDSVSDSIPYLAEPAVESKPTSSPPQSSQPSTSGQALKRVYASTTPPSQFCPASKRRSL